MQTNNDLIAKLCNCQISNKVHFGTFLLLFATSKGVSTKFLRFIFIVNYFENIELGLVLLAVELFFHDCCSSVVVFNHDFIVLGLFDFTNWVNKEGADVF